MNESNSTTRLGPESMGHAFGDSHAVEDYSSLTTGIGFSYAQHGELFQGQIEDEYGKLRRCLVSLPCTSLYARARFEPDLSGVLEGVPTEKSKALRAVQVVLEYLAASRIGGLLEIQSNVPEGKGYGSSTADCAAAAQAASRSIGVELTANETARLVVRAEVASDNFMHDHAVLFAQREGVVLEDYHHPLPEVEVLGIDTDDNATIDTLAFAPAEYSWCEIESFKTVLAALRRAVRHRDIELLGRVATASATINQRFLSKPLFNEVNALAQRAGALGVGVAHSGTVLSLLLAPNDPKLEYRVDSLREGLGKLGISDILRFRAPRQKERQVNGHGRKVSVASA
jgi:uncharacterized protein involved in propanediol utilization